VRLNSNENPLGISPAAKDALVEAIVLANRYPSDQQGKLVTKLAAAHEVAENQIVIGTGSAEVLQMVVQAYAAPRARLVMADPTYEAVTNYQRTEAYELVKVPLTADPRSRASTRFLRPTASRITGQNRRMAQLSTRPRLSSRNARPTVVRTMPGRSGPNAVRHPRPACRPSSWFGKESVNVHLLGGRWRPSWRPRPDGASAFRRAADPRR